MPTPEQPGEDQGGTLVHEGAAAARETPTVVRGDGDSTLVRDAAASATDTYSSDSRGAPVQLDSADSPVTLETPGRYQMTREFGRGGQAVVWLAHDEHIGRDVALKLLAPGSGSSQGHISKGSTTVRFLREARVTGQLEHPSIVPVYELGQRSDGSLYYTQKLVRAARCARRSTAARTCVTGSRCSRTSPTCATRSRTLTAAASCTATSSPRT
jgi:serine/threonine-protein kinase